MGTSEQPAAGPWRTDEPPKDGTIFLSVFRRLVRVAQWDTVTETWVTEGGWMYDHPPKFWAQINMPEVSDERSG